MAHTPAADCLFARQDRRGLWTLLMALPRHQQCPPVLRCSALTRNSALVECRHQVGHQACKSQSKAASACRGKAGGGECIDDWVRSWTLITLPLSPHDLSGWSVQCE